MFMFRAVRFRAAAGLAALAAVAVSTAAPALAGTGNSAAGAAAEARAATLTWTSGEDFYRMTSSTRQVAVMPGEELTVDFAVQATAFSPFRRPDMTFGKITKESCEASLSSLAVPAAAGPTPLVVLVDNPRLAAYQAVTDAERRTTVVASFTPTAKTEKAGVTALTGARVVDERGSVGSYRCGRSDGVVVAGSVLEFSGTSTLSYTIPQMPHGSYWLVPCCYYQQIEGPARDKPVLWTNGTPLQIHVGPAPAPSASPSPLPRVVEPITDADELTDALDTDVSTEYDAVQYLINWAISALTVITILSWVVPFMQPLAPFLTGALFLFNVANIGVQIGKDNFWSAETALSAISLLAGGLPVLAKSLRILSRSSSSSGTLDDLAVQVDDASEGFKGFADSADVLDVNKHLGTAEDPFKRGS